MLIDKKKMGRPTKAPKVNGYRIRLTDGELQKLDECCKLTKMSKADIIRLGIEKVYESVKK